MSNAITTFNNDVLNASIRTTTDENNEPWFCLADVCKALELKTNDVKKRLKHPGVYSIGVGVQTGFKQDGTPAMQTVNMLFVNEANLYRVIMRSDKPQAEAFQDWVCEEVLPSIRKTGKYSIKKEDEALDDGAFAVEVAHFILGNRHISVANKINMCQSIFGNGKIPSVADIKAKGTQKPTPPKAKQGDLFAGSSAPLRLLLNGRGITSHRFNQILEKKGYIEQLYCNSNSHSYYVLTDKGKEYGYNIGSASYSIIHWRIERFDELFRIVTNSAAK